MLYVRVKVMVLCCIIFKMMHVQGCSANGSGSCVSYKSNLLDDVVREKILVSACQIWIANCIAAPVWSCRTE